MSRGGLAAFVNASSCIISRVRHGVDPSISQAFLISCGPRHRHHIARSFRPSRHNKREFFQSIFKQISRTMDQSDNIESLATLDFQRATMPTADCKKKSLLEVEDHMSSRQEGDLKDNLSQCHQDHHTLSIESEKLDENCAKFDSSEQLALSSEILQEQETEEMRGKPAVSIDGCQSEQFSSSKAVPSVILHDQVKAKIGTGSQKNALELQPLKQIYTRRRRHANEATQSEMNSSTEMKILPRHRKNVDKQVEAMIGTEGKEPTSANVQEVQPLSQVYARQHNLRSKQIQSEGNSRSETKIPGKRRKSVHDPREDHLKDASLSLHNGDKEFPDLEVVGSPRKSRNTIKQTRVPESEIVASMTSQENFCLVNTQEPWTVLVHKKIQPGWVAYNPATMRPSNPGTQMKFLKLLSWNVNGLRALLKGELQNSVTHLQRENFDVLCLQETKLQDKDVQGIKESFFSTYQNSFWSCSISKLGYSGTAILSKQQPLSVRYGIGIKNHDSEGRLITLEFEAFYLVAGYVPNSGQKLERLAYRTEEWDICLSNYLKDIEKSKPVILTGDLNCAYQEIDIYNPDGNRRSAGFTNEERNSFETNFLNKGFVDSFRRQHPNSVAYTYWGYRGGARSANKGWRLDYFLASETIADLVYDSYTLPYIFGSDHCPIGLIVKTS